MTLSEQDRECPSCGVLRRPDECPRNRGGELQDNCRSCLQFRKDTTKAVKAGFASAEEYREFRAREKARKRVQLAEERAAARPELTPEDTLRYRVASQMKSALRLWLQEYDMMSKLIADAVITDELSPGTFAGHLQRQWMTDEDREPYFLNVTTQQGKRWVGGWPFMCGKASKPPIPVQIQPVSYWP